MLSVLERTMYYISFPLAFMSFVLPVYAYQSGATPLQIGLLFSVFSLVTVILRPLVGNWVDQHGRKGTLVTGLFFYVLVQLVLWIDLSYMSILLARILQSVASSFLWISVYAMIADVSDGGDYAAHYGSVLQASNRGDFAGAMAGFGLLFLFWNQRGVLHLIFGGFLIISVYALFTGWRNVKDTWNRPKEKISSAERLPAAEKLSANLKAYLGCIGLMALVGSMMSPMLLVYFQQRISTDYWQLMVAWIPAQLLENYLFKSFGQWADRHGRRRFLVWGLAGEAVLVCIFPGIGTIVGFAILNMALTVAGMAVQPAQTAMISEMTQNRRFGKSYGYYATVTGIGGFIGPMVGGMVYQSLSPAVLFYLQGGATMIAALVVHRVVTARNDGGEAGKIDVGGVQERSDRNRC